MSTEQGRCPKCQTDDLNYGSLEPVDDSLYYPYTCNKCGFEGKEWYTLQFAGHWDTDGIEQ